MRCLESEPLAVGAPTIQELLRWQDAALHRQSAAS
jgi:hypothetical protein